MAKQMVEVKLNPRPGFCLKTITTDDNGSYFATSPGTSQSATRLGKNELLELEPSASPLGSILEVSSSNRSTDKAAPSGSQSRTRIPKGTKFFLNIAWDASVPSPPQVPESAIRQAMKGDDLDGENENTYYVPVVVSNPREVVDKKGSPSLVVDCVFSEKLKERSKKDRDYRLYLMGMFRSMIRKSRIINEALTELALEHVEEKTGCMLSRDVGTPNIASKGALESRTVLVPEDMEIFKQSPITKTDPLITEVGTSSRPTSEQVKAKPKSILKSSSAKDVTAASGQRQTGLTKQVSSAVPPAGVQPKRPLIEEISSSDNTHPQMLAKKNTNKTDSTSAVVYTAATDSNGVGGAAPPLAPLVPGAQVGDAGLELEDVSVEEMRRRMSLPPMRWTWIQTGEKVRIEVNVASLVSTISTSVILRCMSDCQY